jgi:hypothetical protein
MDIEQSGNDLLLDYSLQGVLAIIQLTGHLKISLWLTHRVFEPRHARSLQHERVTLDEGKNRGDDSPAT